jgi:hypothetical protein
MSSYQSPTPTSDPTSRWFTFTAAVAISAATRDWLAGKITTRRRKIRSRWRLLDPTTQATLVLAFLRTNLTYAELAAANHISRSTCRRIINEGIDLLAERAIRLSEVLRCGARSARPPAARRNPAILDSQTVKTSSNVPEHSQGIDAGNYADPAVMSARSGELAAHRRSRWDWSA